MLTSAVQVPDMAVEALTAPETKLVSQVLRPAKQGRYCAQRRAARQEGSAFRTVLTLLCRLMAD